MGSLNLLEKNVEKILELAGFDPDLRTQLEGYEIDVLLEYKTIQAIFECKQYEKSNLTVRNLIHEWSGKNEEIGADKVILVLVGISISEEDYELAEKRDIEIWDGDKVDELLDQVTEGHDNIKEMILSEAGLESTEEIENRINELQNEYNVSRFKAKKHLKGDLSKAKLENYSEMNNNLDKEVLEVLTETEKERYANGTDYYHSTIEKIEFMQENQIYNKDLAERLVEYSDQRRALVDTISEYNDCDIREANNLLEKLVKVDGRKEDFNTAGEIPTESFLMELLEVLDKRDDLEFEDVRELVKMGYTCTQLKQMDDPDNAHRPEKRSIEDFTVLGPYKGNSSKYSHVVACPECDAKRGIDASLRDNDTIQCSNCNSWNHVRNIEMYGSEQVGDSEDMIFELKSEYWGDSKNSTYLFICPNCGEEGKVDLSRKSDGDMSECWNCEGSYPLRVPSDPKQSPSSESSNVNRKGLIERITEFF